MWGSCGVVELWCGSVVVRGRFNLGELHCGVDAGVMVVIKP